jgi:hypothetical protein
MAILTSPGVEVTIIDESQYIPAATNSVPFFLIATAQDKVSGTGTGVAAGTLAVNANKTYLITSQRDLSATFGNPFFYSTSAGTQINGYELNEYGLLAAYSSLGVSNRAYVQRVDIDLAELTASLTRPTGYPADGTYWLDTASTTWGIFEWNQTTSAFTNKIPLVITSTTYLQPSTVVPLNSIGAIGDYSVVAAVQVAQTAPLNQTWFKRGGPTSSQTSDPGLSDLYNTWVQVGTMDWQTSWPTIAGTLAPASLTAGNSIYINGTQVSVPVYPNNTVAGLSNAIYLANIPGVYAGVINGKLNIYANSDSEGDGSTMGTVTITNGTGTPLTSLGITPTDNSVYYAPTYLAAYSYQAPRWRTTDVTPEPTGSVWQKMNSVNLGMNLSLKKWNSTLEQWVQQQVPVYDRAVDAYYALDPTGGGYNIPVGTTIAVTDVFQVSIADCVLLYKFAAGPTRITGTNTAPSFTNGNQFTIETSDAGNHTFPAYTGTATIVGTDAAAFVQAVQAANVPNVSAEVNSDGAIVLIQSQGGTVVLNNIGGGTAIANAGFSGAIEGVGNYFNDMGVLAGLAFSNFTRAPFWTYTSSTSAPDQDPADGRLWYYSAANQVDIMIQNDGAWMGYQMVDNDVRGYDLGMTNPTGPICAATAPTTQTDSTPLVYGDLWVDTGDLVNYPALYRWQDVEGVNQWVLINNADQTTENGILFADARWATNGNTNPITDPIPTITSLLTSPYLDPDAPDPALYPQGTLLWNTRRSGYNVKSFQVDYFNAQSYPDFTGTVTNAWVTASGNKADGSPYMGSQAQRIIIVNALKSGIDSNVDIREEQRVFNLIACPSYPELLPNLVVLNDDRADTAFIVGDTPMTLPNSATDLTAWANNTTGAGLTVDNAYVGVFWPSCQTTNPTTGATVVTCPSHMMVRTVIRNDEVAFPWFAPAGTRRGVVDNATAIGYINAATGEFQSIGVNQGIRDVGYENRINPLTFVPGTGITNFGNKTTQSVASALDRINVARLIVFLRSRLTQIGKGYLFEPNDQITRNEISNQINSLMIDLVAKRGIYDYLVVCDLSNNTPARIDRNELWVDIAIEPVKAVEFIYIPVRIKNTGEIAAQTAA